MRRSRERGSCRSVHTNCSGHLAAGASFGISLEAKVGMRRLSDEGRTPLASPLMSRPV